ncbi:alpha/beta hydrolase family protein [Roseibium sp. M-1]
MKIGLILSSISGYMAALGVIDRPQTPKRRDYVIEHLRIPGGDASVILDAELTLPKGSRKVPAIVLISGSGRQNKNEELAGHKPFLVLSDYLTRRGYGVLRFDDRGHGQSTGDFSTATARDFAADAAAALSYLKSHPRVSSERTGYLGHSEGGYIAPLAQTREPAAFQIYLAGPALPLLPDVMTTQVADIARAEGADADAVQNEINLVKDLTAILRTATSRSELRIPLTQLFTGVGADKSAIKANLAMWATRWAMDYASYDPRPPLQSLDIPVLALFGEKDLQVSASQNAPVMKELLSHPQSRTLVLPQLNHLFQPTCTGRVSEYLRIKTTIDPAALDAIGGWLDEVASPETDPGASSL